MALISYFKNLSYRLLLLIRHQETTSFGARMELALLEVAPMALNLMKLTVSATLLAWNQQQL
jgi:hypothetical protein